MSITYPFAPTLRDTVARHLEAFDWRAIDLRGRRPAAVAAIVARDDHGRACYLVTRRAATLRAHTGQLALPGGRIDRDESVIDAALRETREEIGIDLPPSAVLGRLDDYATRSGYVISPVVVWADGVEQFRPNPAEVEHIHLVPLASLDHPDVPRLVPIPESDRPVLQLPLGSGGYLNAPTAAIIYQLWEVGIRGRPTRVAHYEQPVWAWR